MQEVNKYIQQLLYHHDCVILPDFGGFISNYRPAKIDFVNFNVYPPGKDISFNRNIKNNDGLLVNHIASLEQLSFNESKKIVVGFVKKTSKKLHNGESVSFEGIGKFFFDKHKALQFIPDLSANYLLDSYGLSSFHFAPVVTEENEKQDEIRIRPIRHKEFNRSLFLKRAAIAIPAILVFSVINYNSDRITDQFSGISSLIPFQVQSSTTENEISQKFEIVKERESTIDASDVLNIIPENEEESVLVKKYYIIAGSFLDTYNAGLFADKLRKKKFEPILLPEEKGKFRVAFSGYADKNKALQELARLRDNTEPNAWLLLR